MPVRGIRGATIAEANTEMAILDATRELLVEIMETNPALDKKDIASAIFSVSPELNAAYPAVAARELKWDSVPLFCTKEIDVPNGLENCIRVLIHWNTNQPQDTIKHVYLRGAQKLRPDINHSK